MTTQYTESNRLPAYQHARDLDAREALQRIEADKARNFTRHRFQGESIAAHRLRLGLAVLRPIRGLSANDKLSAAFAAFWLLLAAIFIASIS